MFFLFVGVFQATLADLDHALSSHPRSQHEVSDVVQCFKKCHNDSQCLSFNFEYATVKLSKTCELNGVTKSQDPNHYVNRPGFTCYEKVGWLSKRSWRCLVPRRLSSMCAQRKAGRRQRARRKARRRFDCGLYPSCGPLRFITSHSVFALASATRKTKRLWRTLKLTHILYCGKLW